MKIVFTSVLVLMMTAMQAMPVDKDSVENGKKARVSAPATTPASTSLVSMQQLQEENAALKNKIAEMENRLENENSLLQYRYVMLNVFSKLNDNKKMESLEELQSQVGFTTTMSNVLLKIKSETAK